MIEALRVVLVLVDLDVCNNIRFGVVSDAEVREGIGGEDVGDEPGDDAVADDVLHSNVTPVEADRGER